MTKSSIFSNFACGKKKKHIRYMKNIIAIVSLLLCGSTLFAQDIITKKDGTDIQAKVTEVSNSQIVFKKFSNLDGPSYKMDVADILMITYENGEREMFNVETAKSDIPSGVMTYNSWSGKISVGGVTIENGMLDRYFTPEDLEMYKSGKTMSTIGGIIGVVGAVPFGYGAGYMLGWALGGGGKPQPPYDKAFNAAKWMAIIGGLVMIGGLAINIPGENKMKTAIDNYNSALTYRPTLHIGGTQNGIGIAYVF